MKKNLDDFKEFSEGKRYSWFAPHVMELFDCKVESRLIDGLYFVTSERFAPSYPKRFTVRKADWHTGTVDTIGDYQQYETLKEANEAITKLTKRFRKA